MIETIDVAIGEIEPHPDNAKTHDIPLIKESIERFDQYRAIVVQKPTGRRKRYRILAGHGTWQAMRELGRDQITVHVREVDDVTAKRIVLIDNRSTEIGGWNEQALTELLSSMPDLEATGYTQTDLDKMVGKMLDNDEPGTEPALGAIEYRIVIECDGEEHQAELLERLEADGLRVQAIAQ